MDPSQAELLLRYDLAVPAVSLDWVKELVQVPVRGLRVHLKVDTGMHRIGTGNLDELRAMLTLLQENGAAVEGIFTHFACSDNPDNGMTDDQAARFEHLVQALDTPFRWVHSSNSDAAVHYPKAPGNAVRCGLAMFGVTSYATALKPCVSLYSRLVYVKALPAGSRWAMGRPIRRRKRSGSELCRSVMPTAGFASIRGGNAGLKGKPGDFVGRICMDQAMIRLPHAFPVGTKVELFGPHLPLEQVARELGTIPYEVLTLLSDRLAKVYIEDGRIREVANPRLDRLMQEQ